MVSLNGVSRQVGGAPQEVYSRPSVAHRPRLLHRVDWVHLCKYFVNVCRFLFPFFFSPHFLSSGLPMNDGGTRPRRRDAPLTEERGRTCSCSLQDQSSTPRAASGSLRTSSHSRKQHKSLWCSVWRCVILILPSVKLTWGASLLLFRSSSTQNFTPLFPFLLSRAVSSPSWASRSRLSQAVARWLMMGCLSIGNWWVTRCQWPWIPTRLQSPVATAAVYYDEKGLQKHHWENKISACVKFSESILSVLHSCPVI